MIDRINLLLKAKNITARQFAEEIGIQPSGMSHILSGRNNPSLDFMMKVVKRWPEVNIYWLMLGKGEMFSGMPLNASQTDAAPRPIQSSDNQVVAPTGEFDLFSQPDPMPVGDNVSNLSATHEAEETNTHTATPINNEMPVVVPSPAPKSATDAPVPENAAPTHVNVYPHENRVFESAQPPAHKQENLVSGSVYASAGKRIAKIVVLYEDHTFSEYYPE